jgi:hypothetical protein
MRNRRSRCLRDWARRVNAALASIGLACILLGSATAPGFCQVDVARPNAGEAATRVRLNIYLADLSEVSGASQTFVADVVVAAEWMDPRLAGRWPGVHKAAMGDIWNPNLQLVNQRSVATSLPGQAEVDPSGLVHWRQRFIGRFSVRMDLRDFPFDRQRFGVQVVSLGYGRDEVDLVANPEQSGRSKDLSITDWDIGSVQIQTADFEPAPSAKVQAGIQLSWDGRRYIGYYVVQIILPLVLIVLMGGATLWLDPSVVPARVSMAMTTMLTLIAYRFALGNSVPNLTYLTRFDYFMLASTILVFLILLLVVASAHLVGKQRLRFVHRMDTWARTAFPLVFAAVLVAAWLQ